MSIDNHKNTWVHDFGDFKLVLDTQDNDLSWQVKHTGGYYDEQLETKIIKENVKKNMTVLDLGANLGFYSMLSASIVGEGGKVISFEPFPHNANLIKSSIQENSSHNITVINAAVSDKNTTTKLYLSPYYSSEHSLFDYHYSTGSESTLETTDIEVMTVDYYFEKYVGNFDVDFIKMDIEGSEGHAIDGMNHLINENEHLQLLTEFWPNALENSGVSPKDYLLKLEDLGFEFQHIDGLKQEIYPVTLNELVDIMDDRINGHFEQYKQISLGNWYTTLLCKK